jgi:hypothetical protein
MLLSRAIWPTLSGGSVVCPMYKLLMTAPEHARCRCLSNAEQPRPAVCTPVAAITGDVGTCVKRSVAFTGRVGVTHRDVVECQRPRLYVYNDVGVYRAGSTGVRKELGEPL